MSTPPSGDADFNKLSEAEKRAVAERILRIKESGWKPFWCPNPACSGAPHALADEDGAMTLVSDFEVSTDDKPIGHLVTDAEGRERIVLDPRLLDTGEQVTARVLLDPNWAHNHARVDQRLPAWINPWVLFIMSGRGTGKTRTGVEFVTLCARKGLDGAIVGRRGTELENTHVKALIEHAHPEFVPTYLASKDILVWPNGATTFLFSAERPENIRSVNLSYAWVDEAAFMDEIETAWSNLKLATRIETPGNPIHILITSTPTSTAWVMKMEDDEDVEIRRVSTYANRANLSADFLADLQKNYEGTRLGRQELHGEVLRDVEGAMWNDDMFHHLRLTPDGYEEFLETLDARVLAVDPAGSKGPKSDSHGIIGVGATHGTDASQFYVVLDATIKGTPSERSAAVFKAARYMRADFIVVEKNFGGEDVKQGLIDYAKLHPEEAMTVDGDSYADVIKLEHASVSKETRAEPTVGKYEQGRVTHVVVPGSAYVDMSALEKEQTMWVPKSRGGRSPSPNRVDALVWAVRALEKAVRHKTVTAGRNVLKHLKGRGAAPPQP